MIYFCCDQLRRNKLVGSAFNGIDYLEVLDHEIETTDPAHRQKRLVVHFINGLAPNALSAGNIRIEGGERIRGIIAVNAAVDAGDPKSLNVLLNQYGDFSIYTLRLVQNLQNLQPPDGFDLLFSAVDFSFKVDCPTDFDCKPRCDCDTPIREEPEIDYLAKDYSSFRRLMLDRMAALMPAWQERNPADLGVTLVEALAYVGDYLSYQQDAIATEAYLGTARRRVSVRRHARLVDYAMHDGCNARVWVQVQVSSDFSLMEPATQLFTRIPGQAAALPDDPRVQAQAHEIFETMEDVALFEAHNEIHFYSWSDQRCCLPKGATHATLVDSLPNLKAGDVLIFEEILGPNTGRKEDANPAHRHAVRLVHVESQDSAGQPLTDPLTTQPITEIYWSAEDALPFPLCISAETDSLHGNQLIDDVSIARGNIALADHGYTTTGEPLGTVPKGLVARTAPTDCNRCDPQDPTTLPVRFRPTLKSRPLTFATPQRSRPLFGFASSPADLTDLDNKTIPLSLQKQLDAAAVAFPSGASIQGHRPLWSVSDSRHSFIIKHEQNKLNIYARPGAATASNTQDPRKALPAARLHSQLDLDETDWDPAGDLLNSGPTDPQFVAEVEDDGEVRLRFGDGRLGWRLKRRALLTRLIESATARPAMWGLSPSRISSARTRVLRGVVTLVRNPKPAEGGIDPETATEVRAYAPAAFRTQERAVTEADYAEVTERHPGVQRANGHVSLDRKLAHRVYHGRSSGRPARGRGFRRIHTAARRALPYGRP